MNRFDYFDARYDGGILEICLRNPMYYDTSELAELRDELHDLVKNFRPRKLLVNFTNVRYCSTAIINALLVVQQTMSAYYGQMRFCGMNESVRQSFAMLKLDGPVFEIHSTTASALAGFRG
jgi:anti-anti-sigma regulatory factor